MRELTRAANNRFRGGVQRAGVNGPATWHDTEPNRDINAATTTEEKRYVTDHVTPHDHDDGLFRTAEPDEQQLASKGTGIRPMTRPSQNLFHNAANHEAAERQR